MDIKIATRSLQEFGGTSLYINLPETWAKDHGLKQKDKLDICQREDGALVILPPNRTTESQTEPEAAAAEAG